MKLRSLLTRTLMTAAAIVAAIVGAPSTVRATLITNGDFQTGDLTGWTTFTTSANGAIGTPTVVSFDTTGSGASLGARLQVGEVSFTGVQEGGGLLQSFSSASGTISISLDVATYFPFDFSNNASGGKFSLLLDSVVVDTASFGTIDGNGGILRDSLSYSGAVVGGSHTLGILMTRPYLTVSDNTPYQFVDNVVVNVAPVPEPTTALFGLALVGFCTTARRRRA